MSRTTVVSSVGVLVGLLAIAWAYPRVEPFRQQLATNQGCCQLEGFRNLVVAARELTGAARYPSQSGQDKWVLERMFPGVTDGFFLDVGSGDGVEHSNTWALEQRGWKGICVDPFPSNMAQRTCQVFRDVVWSESGRVMTFRNADGLGGLEPTLDRWREQAMRAPALQLTTTTLADILAKADAPAFIHFLSLDIEGAELEALNAFPFDRFTIGAIALEHNYEEPKRGRIIELLARHGYRRTHSYYQDDFFAHDRRPPD